MKVCCLFSMKLATQLLKCDFSVSGVSQSTPKELPPDTLSTNQTLTEGPSSEHPVSQKQVKLLCLVYTVLITKSLVYCCGVSLLRLIRRSRKHAAD